MKSLDERMSEIVSVYDEVDVDQSELLNQQYFEYQKDIILNSIGKTDSRVEFDLNLEELLEKFPKGVDYSLFLLDCLKKLSSEYYLDELLDHIERDGLVLTNPDSILELIKFFVYDNWLYFVSECTPTLNPSINYDKKMIYNIISESFLSIQNIIIERGDVNPYIRYYFTYCSQENGIQLIVKLIMMDLPGVISTQALKTIMK